MVNSHETGAIVDECTASPKRSFAPLARGDARILILGSLPGQRSLHEQQYYAHPQNAFWRVMQQLVGAHGTYAERCAMLLDNRLAVWDVLYESVRPGSMDADIRLDTARVNDFAALFVECPGIRRVCFNGRKAAALYGRLVDDDCAPAGCEFFTLPSTSPAYAAMSFADKLETWRAALTIQE